MINRTDLIIINLNQSYSSSEIKLKKDENTRWVYFSLILVALLGNLFWFIHINMNINQLIEQREDTISQLGVDTEKLKQKGRINLSKKDIENLYNGEKNRVTWADNFTEIANITNIEINNKTKKIESVGKQCSFVSIKIICFLHWLIKFPKHLLHRLHIILFY